MVDEPDGEDDTTAPDVAQWSDAEFHRAAALMAYTADADELEPDEQPNYDW